MHGGSRIKEQKGHGLAVRIEVKKCHKGSQLAVRKVLGTENNGLFNKITKLIQN